MWLHRAFHRFSFFICAILWQGAVVYGQVKKTPVQQAPAKKDTSVIYINEPRKAPKPVVSGNSPSDMKETVIIIRPHDTVPKPKVTYMDTVIILKKGLTKQQLAEREKEKVVEVQKTTTYCECVKMDIKVPVTLQYETYLSYSFIFKNTCKIDVWISSKHFRFTPLNTFDLPVKVLRKLSFVQRYDHPDFVKIAPGETYTFSYADDAFFEYDLKKGENYKFIFEHRNFGDKSKHAPEKTYLCGQKRVQLITIK